MTTRDGDRGESTNGDGGGHRDGHNDQSQKADHFPRQDQRRKGDEAGKRFGIDDPRPERH